MIRITLLLTTLVVLSSYLTGGQSIADAPVKLPDNTMEILSRTVELSWH